MTRWCVEVGPVANARESSTQEHDQAKVVSEMETTTCQQYSHMVSWLLFLLMATAWTFHSTSIYIPPELLPNIKGLCDLDYKEN